MTTKINTALYYKTYAGHETRYLRPIYQQLRADHPSLIFLAGDSSLDNKYWFNDQDDACNGFEKILDPPTMKQDVCYWLNRELVNRQRQDVACINTAIEATSLNTRSLFCLPDQDRMIRDKITEDDYLIVSIGGNDIALTPLLCTALSILPLVCCTPKYCYRNEKCTCAHPPNCPFDAGCLCCGLGGCLVGMIGCPPGLGYFVDLFRNRIQNYVSRLVQKRKPKKILICMIYNPDEISGGSWADPSLALLGYNRDPEKLQLLIKIIFKLATSQIRIPGCDIVPVLLADILDGKNTDDYRQRVEPSPTGGRKMANAFLDIILDNKIITARANSADALLEKPPRSTMNL